MNKDLEHRITQLEHEINTSYSNVYIDGKLKELESKFMKLRSNLGYAIIKPRPQYLTTSTNSYFNVPIKSSDIKLSRGNLVSISDSNKITIDSTGIYQVNVNMTVEVPEGQTKYSIDLFTNDKDQVSLSKGYFQSHDSTWFSISGSTVVNLTEKDTLEVKYIFNTGKSLAVKLVSISIIKL